MLVRIFKSNLQNNLRNRYCGMLTRFVTRSHRTVTRFFSRRRSAAARRWRLMALVPPVILVAGCSYIFSEKRTNYQFEPSYGVESPQFLRSLDALGTEMVPGNAARLLQNGDGIFSAMLAEIAAAKLSVNLETYIFSESVIGKQLADALSERARAGVEVRVLVDGWGSSLGPLEVQMTAAGVVVRTYKPLRIYSIDRVGNRTHRRILTIDGKVGYCGGVGFDDRWLGDARNPKEWRDTMVEVRGPVVIQLQHVFAQDWFKRPGEVRNAT